MEDEISSRSERHEMYVLGHYPAEIPSCDPASYQHYNINDC